MFEIRQTLKKGLGMFACCNIKQGDTILQEDPIISCQFAWNKLYKYLACDYCLKSLESAEKMCQRLCETSSIILPHQECCESRNNQTATCNQCNMLYCSSICRDKAYSEYHQVLCPYSDHGNVCGLEQLDEAWRTMHYPPETATIWLLARIMAHVRTERDKTKFISLIEEFCHQSENKTEGLVHKLLGDKFQGQLTVLREQLKTLFYSEEIAHWFTEDGFQKLFALLGTNQQGIGSSGLSVWVKNCDELELSNKDKEELDTFIDKLYENLEEVAGCFLNCEGVGLYREQSKCNHSCCPNAEVCFLYNNHRLTIRAIDDIPSGEEITISYLTECESTRSRYSRQKFLRENYLFTCACDKCFAESDDPECTSDDESEDMDEEETND